MKRLNDTGTAKTNTSLEAIKRRKNRKELSNNWQEPKANRGKTELGTNV